MVDIAKEKLEGEARDFQQGSGFHQRTKILASDKYDVSEKSDLIIITAGVAQKPGESRLSLVERNARIMKMIMPEVLKYSPEGTILIVSNPCDIMTAIAAKIAGKDFPQGKVFGAGTVLDSSRFQTLIAESMDLDPKNVHGYIIGEHGDSSIPVWSSVRVGALPLLDPGQEADETLGAIHKAVVDSAYNVINLKGYTNWAIGMSTAYIARAVLHDVSYDFFPYDSYESESCVPVFSLSVLFMSILLMFLDILTFFSGFICNCTYNYNLDIAEQLIKKDAYHLSCIYMCSWVVWRRQGRLFECPLQSFK